jgi:hypothetical protein
LISLFNAYFKKLTAKMIKKIFTALGIAISSLLFYSATIAQNKFDTNVFLYGASVYPELQTKEEQILMLDLFRRLILQSYVLGSLPGEILKLRLGSLISSGCTIFWMKCINGI